VGHSQNGPRSTVVIDRTAATGSRGRLEQPAAKGEDIVLDHVTKAYRHTAGKDTFVAVSDISMHIEPGEFVSIIGASGCGKTTILKMMCGLLRCDSGSITIGGASVTGVPENAGFVFQEPALLPWRTLHDNLAFVLAPRKLPKDQVNEMISAELARAGLTDFAKYYPHQTSGGMQQRVGLARALVGRPQVLLMDEPLSALDAFTRLHLQEEIAQIIAGAETTTVLVTHDVDEAVFFSSRVFAMRSGPGRIHGIVEIPMPLPRTHAGLAQNAAVANARAELFELTSGDTPQIV